MSQDVVPDGTKDESTITVIHGRDRHVVQLGNSAEELMQKIAEVASIDVEDQILICGGKKFTAGMNVDLAAVGVRGGKKVMLMKKGRKQTAKPSSSGDSISKDPDEEMCRRVAQAISQVPSLHSEATKIHEEVQPPQSTLDAMSPSGREQLEHRLRVISENCMQMLISLDSLTDERPRETGSIPSWKRERQNAVRRVQDLLDVIDNIRATLGNRG